MSLPTRLAMSFALVAAVVAGSVGLLSFRSTSERITTEIDQSLQSAATALASGQSAVLAPPVVELPGPGGDRSDNGPNDDRQLTAQRIAKDGTTTRLGGRDVALPVSGSDLALAGGVIGQATTDRVLVDGEPHRLLATAWPTANRRSP
jgi:two-component system sensor histidine kinase MprB